MASLWPLPLAMAVFKSPALSQPNSTSKSRGSSALRLMIFFFRNFLWFPWDFLLPAPLLLSAGTNFCSAVDENLLLTLWSQLSELLDERGLRNESLAFFFSLLFSPSTSTCPLDFLKSDEKEREYVEKTELRFCCMFFRVPCLEASPAWTNKDSIAPISCLYLVCFCKLYEFVPTTWSLASARQQLILLSLTTFSLQQ